MKIGFDLDNTIIDYRTSLELLAKEKFNLSLESYEKAAVKEALTQKGGNDLWREAQSLLYSDYVEKGVIHKELIDLLSRLKDEGHNLIIISHKTKTSNWDKSKNFHQPALKFLESKLDLKIFDEVVFSESFDEKVKKICDVECDYFIDDLKEIMQALGPLDPQGVLFSGKPFFWNLLDRIISMELKDFTNFSSNSSEIVKDKNYCYKFHSRRDRYEREEQFYLHVKLDRICDYQLFNKWDCLRLELLAERESTLPFSERVDFLKSIQEFKYDCLSERGRRSSHDYIIYIDERMKDLGAFSKLIDLAKSLKEGNKKIGREYSDEELILSPSDFGQQNSGLFDGEQKYYDFESAGLDHYAKLFSDLTLHPREDWANRNVIAELCLLLKSFKLTKKVCFTELEINFKSIYLEWLATIYNAHNKKEVKLFKTYYESLMNNELPFKINGNNIKIDDFFSQLESKFNE